MRRRRRSYSELEDETLYKSRGKEKGTLEPNVSEVRRVRVERLGSSTSTRRTAATPKMTSESHATFPSLKSASSHRRKDHRRSTVSTKHRTRRKSTSKGDSTPTYVYGTPAGRSQSSRITISEIRKLGRDGESTESEEDGENVATHSEPVREKPKKRKIRVVYIKEDDSKSSRPREERTKSDKEIRDRLRSSHESIQRSRAHTTRRKSIAEERPASPPKRYVQTNFCYTYANLLPSQKCFNKRLTVRGQTQSRKEQYYNIPCTNSQISL